MVNDKSNTSFKEVQEAYEDLREKERTKLLQYLKDELTNSKLMVVNRGWSGRGRKEYTESGNIEKYNLENWKWVEVKCGDEFSCIISLNMPEVDPGTANVHALYDRIGIFVSYKKDSNYYKTSIYTDIDLPFETAEMESIKKIVLEQYEIKNQ